MSVPVSHPPGIRKRLAISFSSADTAGPPRESRSKKFDGSTDAATGPRAIAQSQKSSRRTQSTERSCVGAKRRDEKRAFAEQPLNSFRMKSTPGFGVNSP